MTAADSNNRAPWFRHRMVWLVIAIPALTVAGCLLTISLAVTTPDELVSDSSVEDNAAIAHEQ